MKMSSTLTAATSIADHSASMFAEVYADTSAETSAETTTVENADNPLDYLTGKQSLWALAK